MAFVLYLVVLTWLGLPVMLVQMELGLVLCCLPAFPATGFFYVMLAGLYLSLRNGAQAG